ncbi:hypothetical protein PS3A_43700 [Pseudomonas sp. 3A(2025)]
MSNPLIGSLSNVKDIGGLDLLGRGLNRLDWANSNKECQKVGDTVSDRRLLTWQDNAYAAGQHVDFSLHPGEDWFVVTFDSIEHYEQHLRTHLTEPGCYGAFSAGFSSIFGKSPESFIDQSAAVYSHRVSLWQLSLLASPQTATATFKERLKQLPHAFDSTDPKPYVDFLVEFGVDIVTQVIVGAALNHALIVDSSESNSLQARVKAEFATFVAPGIDAWLDSAPKEPKVVTLETTPVFGFVEPGATRDALEQACRWYAGHAVQIDAHWQDSHIIMDPPVHRDEVHASNEPCLRIVLVDGQTRQAVESHHPAPAATAENDTFERYWAAVSLLLEQKQRRGYKLLLSTDRWPRDPRYSPSCRMREALLQYGALPQTLEQWDQLSRHMQPCALAGLTYALVGNDAGRRGIDGVAAGFGTPGESLKPTVRISARFAHDSFGRLKAIKQAETVVDAQTTLYAIHNQRGNRLALGCDPEDKGRVSLQVPDSSDRRQHWYMPQQEQRYELIRRPTLLINFETGACLQGQRDCSESRLVPLGPRLQDDVLWDLRGEDENFHLLMVYFYPDALHLAQCGSNYAAVRAWRQDGMDWTRKILVS